MEIEEVDWKEAIQALNLPVTVRDESSGRLELRVALPDAEPVILSGLTLSPNEVKTAAQSCSDEVLISTDITPKIAEQLRELGKQFVDLRGNCFISQPGLLIDIRGKRTSRGDSRVMEKRESGSLFSPRRARISAVLLSWPRLLTDSHRQIAAAAGVSVGTAHLTLNLLERAGYLERFQGKWQIADPEGLLEAFAKAYPSGLGDSLLLFQGEGVYRPELSDDPNVFLSGELAIPDLVTGGDTAHVYVSELGDAKKLAIRARLKIDSNGRMVVRKLFWHNHAHSTPQAVIYVDLLSTAQPRLIETAAIVKQRILERLR